MANRLTSKTVAPLFKGREQAADADRANATVTAGAEI